MWSHYVIALPNPVMWSWSVIFITFCSQIITLQKLKLISIFYQFCAHTFENLVSLASLGKKRYYLEELSYIYIYIYILIFFFFFWPVLSTTRHTDRSVYRFLWNHVWNVRSYKCKCLDVISDIVTIARRSRAGLVVRITQTCMPIQKSRVQSPVWADCIIFMV